MHRLFRWLDVSPLSVSADEEHKEIAGQISLWLYGLGTDRLEVYDCIWMDMAIS
jgi:hypothetical protein